MLRPEVLVILGAALVASLIGAYFHARILVEHRHQLAVPWLALRFMTAVTLLACTFVLGAVLLGLTPPAVIGFWAWISLIACLMGLGMSDYGRWHDRS